jgi:hypothetical protein
MRNYALAPWLIRGPDAFSDVLRRSARCGQCGAKGAVIQLPGWGGYAGRRPADKCELDGFVRAFDGRFEAAVEC